jgi:hypothetical protein
MNETFNVLPGGQVNSYQPHGFSAIYGVRIDNFSGGWLGIEGQNLWIPPYTRGWKADIYPSMSSISVRSYDFSNGTLITGATGQNAVVTIWDNEIGDSEGVSFFDEQTVPIRITFEQNATILSPRIVIPAPAVGRLRLYSITFYYVDDVGSRNTFGVTAYIGASGATAMATLDISPASPSATYIFTAPGGDMPIATALQTAEVMEDTLPAPQTPLIGYMIRYAVI